MNSKLKDKIIKENGLSTRMKFLAGDTFVYGLTSTLSKLTTIITFPLLAHYFTVEDYGLINFFNIVVIFLSAFINFGLDSAITRYFVDCETIEDKKQLISQALTYQLILILIFFAVIGVAIETVSTLILNDQNSINYFKVAIIQVPFMIILNYTQNILKLTFEKYKFVIASISFICVNLILLVIFIVYKNADVTDVLMINAFSTFVASLIGLFFIRKWFVFSKSLMIIYRMKNYFIPLGIAGITAAFIPYFERKMVLNILGMYQLGLYSAGYSIANLISLVSQSFMTAWQPIAFSIYKEHDAAKTYNIAVKLYSYLICVCVFFISTLGEFLVLLFAGEKYMQATLIIFPICMSIAIQSIGGILQIGIAFSKKTYLHLAVYLCYFIVVTVLIVSLADSLKIYGVALAVLGAQIIRVLVSYYLAQNAYKIKWKCEKIFYFVLLNILLGISSDYLSYISVTINMKLFCMLLISLIGWTYLFTKEEKVSLIHYVKNITPFQKN